MVATTSSSPTTMSVLSVSQSSDRRRNAFLAQQEYHARHNSQYRQATTTTTTTTNEDNNNVPLLYPHPSHWRHLSALEQPLSNCHLVLWTGEISLGTPGQPFIMDIDTGSVDTWVSSSDCPDEPCWLGHSYDISQSSTAESLNQTFSISYTDGGIIQGQLVQDVMTTMATAAADDDDNALTTTVVFGNVHTLQNYSTCETEDGVLGLAYSATNSNHQPSFLASWFEQTEVVTHKVLSLYFNTQDDYPDPDASLSATDSDGNILGGNQLPISASSEFILGGIRSSNYQGCLEWHSLGHFANVDTGAILQGYWDLSLTNVLVGGTSVLSTKDLESTSSVNPYLAVLDTGSSYILGPPASVAKFAQLNNANCFNMMHTNDPELVDCSSGLFDAAIIDCDQPFFPLDFVIDDVIYSFEKSDLMIQVDTALGPACILRVVGSHGIPGWVLGDVFFNKFYTVFDWENARIGFALANSDTTDVCPDDEYLDVGSASSSLVTTDPPTQSPTAAPTATPTVAATGNGTPTAAPTKEVFDFTHVEPTASPTKDHDAGQHHVSPTAAPTNLAHSSSSWQQLSVQSSSLRLLVPILGLVLFLVILIWKRRQRHVQHQKRMQRIIQHAHDNSPYRDEDPKEEEGETMFEIDLETLHEMN